MPDQPVQAARQLRLVASAPDLPVSSLSFAAPVDAQVRGAPAATGEAAAPATVVQGAPPAQADPVSVALASHSLASERIAALSAVPLSPPPAQEARAMTVVDMASGWLEIASAFLRAHWRQAGLAGALAIAACLLFWRLGERSRHAEQELMLDGRLQEEPVFPVDALLGDGTAEPGRRVEEPLLLDDAMAQDAVPERPQYSNLREALAAMKAEMARTDVGQRNQVDA